LLELKALEEERQRANTNCSICDVHCVNWSSFKYPGSIELWRPNIRNPSYDPRPASAYTLYSQDYADLNGNGRVEAIVQLRQEYFIMGPGRCSSGGQGQTFVFEMDEKCVLHRLAQIKGTACDRARVQGTTLLIDQPRVASQGHSSADEPVCEQPRIRRFSWQFKASKPVSTFSDLCKPPAAN
jgi:hypothetical protein